jgi:signal transduction histidine kinase
VRSEVYQDFEAVLDATSNGVAWSSARTSFGEYRRIFYAVYNTSETPLDEAGEEALDENGMPIEEARVPIAVVEVGRSMEEYHSELRTLTLIIALIGLGGLVLATAGGLFVSRRALEPARLAFERQRQFLADASHELRSPLTLIRASTEAVLLSSRKNLSPEDQESLDDVLSESDRMADLIEDLLLLARLEDKRLQPHAEDFDLSQLLVESARWARSVLANNGTRFTLSAPQALPVRCEREQIVRVLRSILENAIRYTPKGGEIILAGTIKDDEVRVSVQDNGPGLPPGEQQLVFERFYRADPSRNRVSGGTGLGLAIAKGLVENAGGRIWAESAPSSGAIFTFTLPLRTAR